MRVTDSDGKQYTIEPETNLSGADLNSANLKGADLSEVDLSKVNLRRAIWNDETVFPEGFEIPEKNRA